MKGREEFNEREKVPVTPENEPREMEIDREKPLYEGGFESWRRATEVPHRWRV